MVMYGSIVVAKAVDGMDDKRVIGIYLDRWRPASHREMSFCDSLEKAHEYGQVPFRPMTRLSNSPSGFAVA